MSSGSLREMSQARFSETLPSLRKYTRKRQLLAKNGYYLEIFPNGEVGCTRDGSSPNSVLEFLSVGPDLIAIGGHAADKYLAVDNQGKIFTSNSERKECVFRELTGKNFYTLIRTCHSDIHGHGWYLSINNRGRVATKTCTYSDHPQLHFIVKVIKENQENNGKSESTRNSTPVWRRQSMEDFELIDFNSFTPSPMSGVSQRSSQSEDESSGSVENYTSC
ncbi:predicted protein [Nematostella vectensis]|uniref:Fibroblast growth factor n=2 Tax=Nematostella vectensis TaxID=45351 RepID=A7SU37_NEMVE|nr:predicted protein [Nematostella vectensis]|eukprot:XP_001624855.1 predicted protein [Nematostella vectensis]